MCVHRRMKGGGCHGYTSSAGRVAISRSGTESPWRSGSNTAWDSMFLSASDHRFSPGGMKGNLSEPVLKGYGLLTFAYEYKIQNNRSVCTWLLITSFCELRMRNTAGSMFYLRCRWPQWWQICRWGGRQVTAGCCTAVHTGCTSQTPAWLSSTAPDRWLQTGPPHCRLRWWKGHNESVKDKEDVFKWTWAREKHERIKWPFKRNSSHTFVPLCWMRVIGPFSNTQEHILHWITIDIPQCKRWRSDT